MNTVEFVRASAFASISALKYTRVLEHAGLTFDKMIGPLAFCITKVQNKLEFTVNSKTELNFGYNVDVDLKFSGTEIASAPDGRRRIRWAIDTPIAAQAENVLGDSDIDFTHVRGGFTTILTELEATARKWCSGGTREFRVAMELDGNDNSVVANGVLNNLPTTATFRLDTLPAMYANQTHRTVSVELVKDGCGIGAVAGGTAKFHAVLGGLEPGDSPTYSWKATGPGVKSAGPVKTSSVVNVQLSGNAGSIAAKVTVVVGGETLIGERTITSFDARTASLISLLCRVSHIVRLNPFFDPLDDPIKSHIARPPSKAATRHILAEIDRVNALAENIRQLEKDGSRNEKATVAKTKAARVRRPRMR